MKHIVTLFVLGTLLFLAGCQPNATNDSIKKGEIKVTILYPNEAGKTFDMDYYVTQHMPMVARLLGDALNRYSIDEGITGRTPDEPIPYLAIGYLYFDKLSDYQAAFGPNAAQILEDIPNYTNIQPVLQISEVLR